ncbi:MAG: PD-(D/E)XK nuclease family protein, partial [Vicinamibacterales bacterium]
MSTPRDVSLSRVPHLRAAHQVIASLTLDRDSSPIDTVVLVPSAPAALELRRTLALLRPHAVMFPELVSTSALTRELHHRLGEGAPPLLSRLQREALLWQASASAIQEGCAPPFEIRPGIIAEALALYDAVRRHQRDVGDFERALVSTLVPGSEYDRGAARLLVQTRYLVMVFREYERLLAESRVHDEHGVRAWSLDCGLQRPIRRVIVATADHAAEPEGLWPADFDLLTRLDGIERIDVVATDAVLDSGFRLRLFDRLPDLEETRIDPSPQRPTLVTTSEGRPYHLFRDREEELTGVRARARSARSMVVVYERPLPYLYLAERIFGDARVPFATSDTLPLAAQPYVATLDLVFEAIASNLAREAVVRLLESPYLAWRPRRRRLTAHDTWVLRAWLRERRVRGGADAYRSLLAPTPERPSTRASRDAVALRRALRALSTLIDELESLDRDDVLEAHVRALRVFLLRRAASNDTSESDAERRTRAATLALLDELAEAYTPARGPKQSFRESAGFVRRAIEQHTFAYTGAEEGVRLCDARAARYCTSETVCVVGVNEGDWPRPARRTIFYPSGLMKDLGFPADQDRQRFARAAFRDLLLLAGNDTVVSVCQLEDDTLVRPSAFVEELQDVVDAELSARPHSPIPPDEGLAASPVQAPWLHVRAARESADPSFHGQTSPLDDVKITVTQIERYLDCPFKYFSSAVLRLDEEDDRDDIGLDPRRRGTLVHEVFQRFFSEWMDRSGGAISTTRLPEARALFRMVVEQALGTLAVPDAAIERARLIGSAGMVGFGERVFRLEAMRAVPVVERLIEYDLRGTYEFGTVDEPAPVTLTGIADRIDLLADGTLRLVDYKTGQ